MHLYNQLLIHRQKASRGFTLSELLIAAGIGALLTLVAGDALLSHLKSTARLEALERLRSDWGRISHFIESEVALSERVIHSASAINLNQCEKPISDKQFQFALEIGKDLPLAIYFEVDHAEESDGVIWNGDKSLFRCGPRISITGEYSDKLTDIGTQKVPSHRIADGLCGITKDPSNEITKSLDITICLEGIGSSRFSGQTNTYSRVSPIYSYPSSTTLCSDSDLTIEGFIKKSGTSANETLEPPDPTKAVLICGNGGTPSSGATSGDTINGSISHDILEAGQESAPGATISGLNGNDRLVGGNGDDVLHGGNGDDVLIGQAGDDKLNGDSGDNQYLPGTGNDAITGGPDLDVVFLEEERSSFSGLDSCNRTSCTLSYPKDGKTYSLVMANIEVLIFRDGRYDLQ